MEQAEQRADLKKLYERRYEGDYMSEDAFTRWSHSGVELQRVEDTLGRIPPDDIGSVLDYGCGRGEWSDLLRATFTGSIIHGVDISETAIGKAAREHPAGRFRVFDGMRAPYADGSFDLVFTYHVLEHVLDLDDVVADMTRLVRPGGYLCIIFPCGNPGSLEARLVARIEGGLEAAPTGDTRFFYEDPTHLRRMTSDTIIGMLQGHGLALREAFFAHQWFGAIEWISRSGRAFARDLFDTRRAAGRSDRAALRAIGWPVRALALLSDLAGSDPARQTDKRKRLVLRALLPVRLLGRLARRALEALARWEWRTRRTQRNGSAQFLVFLRPA